YYLASFIWNCIKGFIFILKMKVKKGVVHCLAVIASIFFNPKIRFPSKKKEDFYKSNELC
ncbi:MAG: hypothetical protein N2114_02560, partial [Candidatus Goldbacteria bacterium]|nr:hypothetical protein [Candidatus Goldiibacteriota bacterium]